MLRRLLCLAVAALPLAAQQPQVQTDWQLAAVGVDVGDFDVEALLRACEPAIERELPGLQLDFDLEHYLGLVGPREQLGDEELVRWALAEAEAAGLAIAAYDVVFVFSPRFQGAFGRSHIGCRDAAGQAARGAFVLTDAYDMVEEQVLAAIERSPLLGGSMLAEPVGAQLRQLIVAQRPLLQTLFRLPGVREAAAAPTVAHEFGHFLAPGDLDIRDGYQTPWVKHALSEQDNPDQHGIECCMHKGGSIEAILRKLSVQAPRLIAFCDTCRSRLGLLAD